MRAQAEGFDVIVASLVCVEQSENASRALDDDFSLLGNQGNPANLSKTQVSGSRRVQANLVQL